MDNNNEHKNEDVQETGTNNPLTSIVVKPRSRRDFLKIAGIGGAGIVVASMVGCSVKQQVIDPTTTTTPAATSTRTVYTANAKMVVVHDATRCVGCRRCEVACTLFHDNKIQPSISRIKVSRNYNFGPEGPRVGFNRGQGMFGNYRLIADTCLQCPHPTPCMSACPNNAIELDPKTNARVINTQKCTGCQTCVKACPWGMISFDTEAQKSTKCDLCGGDPQCVKICPAGAISYVPWTDRTKEVAIRQVVPGYVTSPADVNATCITCHRVGSTTTK